MAVITAWIEKPTLKIRATPRKAFWGRLPGFNYSIAVRRLRISFQFGQAYESLDYETADPRWVQYSALEYQLGEKSLYHAQKRK